MTGTRTFMRKAPPPAASMTVCCLRDPLGHADVLRVPDPQRHREPRHYPQPHADALQKLQSDGIGQPPGHGVPQRHWARHGHR